MASRSTYSKQSASKLKVELSKVSNLSARNFLLKRGYSPSSFRMPEYYSPSGFDKIKLASIDWHKKNPVVITRPLDVLAPKSNLSWRRFNFLNPYIFMHLVTEISERKNWDLIRKLLTQDTLVHCYSTPSFVLKEGQTLSGQSISNWLQMAEKDVIKDSTEFTHLTVTDIKNFYPSIYTHSIAWAIHGKGKMKKSSSRHDMTLLGNRLDKLFQNARDGQTNGIPVGSMVSDLIAEIILIDIDKKLTSKLKSKNEIDILILRYRDDYRILSKTEDSGKKVLQYLNRILQTEYDLHLNSDKTETYRDIIEGCFRPWMVELKRSNLLRKIYYGTFSENLDSNFLKDCLVETYKLQKEFPGGRACITILTKLAEILSRDISKFKLNSEDIPEIIALLRKLSLQREDVTPQVFLVLDIFLGQIKSNVDRKRILVNLKKIISGMSDQEYQLIWFYRLCLSQMPEMCSSVLNKNKTSLVRILDQKYYKADFDIFDRVEFAAADKRQLLQFRFVDRKRLSKMKNLNIQPRSLNIFKY